MTRWEEEEKKKKVERKNGKFMHGFPRASAEEGRQTSEFLSHFMLVI